MKYRIDLDDFTEEIFHELERINESGHGHELVVDAEDVDKAAMDVCRKLVPLFCAHFKEEI